jgi:hypothetical protein
MNQQINNLSSENKSSQNGELNIELISEAEASLSTQAHDPLPGENKNTDPTTTTIITHDVYHSKKLLRLKLLLFDLI